VLRRLLRPGRVVVVDEAFMDAVPGEPESLAPLSLPGLVVVRSLTKHWGIPGVRAGYLLADPETRSDLAALQVPWSVSGAAAAAMVACATPQARAESTGRAAALAGWRAVLEQGLAEAGVPHQASSASFVLAELGVGAHAALRDAGIAVRRCDTFPGLGPDRVRIAVRPPDLTRQLLAAIDDMRNNLRPAEAFTANMP
jgi:histidinol-phosphate/aromatic aminotransferase/cobyric acid decarboxylase-like protein